MPAAPAIFQESLLQDLEGIFCYLDDLLISSGPNNKMCLKLISNVLDWLKTEHLQLKKTKFMFQKKNLQFLGHTISDNMGLTERRKGPSYPEYAKSKERHGTKVIFGHD